MNLFSFDKFEESGRMIKKEIRSISSEEDSKEAEQESEKVVQDFILQHWFNRRVQVIFPTEIKKDNLMQVEMQDFFYQLKIPSLWDLISFFGFSNKDKKEDHASPPQFQVFCLTLSKEMTETENFTILPNGNLLFNLSKYSYQSLGLEGKPSIFSKKTGAENRLISIDLLRLSKKQFQRVQTRLQQTQLFRGAYCSCLILKEGKCCDLIFPSGFESKKNYCVSSSVFLETIFVPSIEKLVEDHVEELLEWIGFISVSQSTQNLLRPQNKMEQPFLFAWKEDEFDFEVQTGNCQVLKWDGLISPQIIVETVLKVKELVMKKQVRWGIVTVWGCPTSLISWKNFEHHINYSAENDYSIVILPKSQTSVCYFLISILNDSLNG